MNYFVTPPYYKGTSFEEMSNSIKLVAKANLIDFEIVGASKPMENELNNDLVDDYKYTYGQAELIYDLMKLKNPSNMLFLDFFNPGIDLLRYYHEQKNIKCKYGALYCGGTFLDNDLYDISWLNTFEKAWGNLYSKIYCPAKFVKTSFPKNLRSKLIIKPFGMDGFPRQKKSIDKIYDIVFPHRLNKDKGIDDLHKIASKNRNIHILITAKQKKSILSNNKYYKKLSKLPNIEFLFGINNKQLIDILSKSTILLSCAYQELFGYSVMNAILLGNIPVLPNRQIYPQYFPKKFLYQNINEAESMIKEILNNPDKYETARVNIQNKVDSFSFSEILKDFFAS